MQMGGEVAKCEQNGDIVFGAPGFAYLVLSCLIDIRIMLLSLPF
jgi:hypothetical protein